MKNLKKALALLLALTMLLCLSACGSFEKKMAKSAAKMSRLNSMHMDMEVQLGLGIVFMGQREDMDMAITAGIDMNMEPFAMKMDMDMETRGVRQNMLIYVLEEDGQRRSYISDDGGGTWIKGEPADMELAGNTLNARDSLKLLSQWAESFAQAGEEKINGSAATKYSGEITAESMKEALALAGAEGILEERLGADFEGALDNLGDVPVSIWIDNKSGMVARVEMDLTAMMQGVFAGILDAAVSGTLEAYGLEGLPVEIDIRNAVVTVDYSQFDEVAPIELPAGAK